MGGRRKSKQGIPPALDESKITFLKKRKTREIDAEAIPGNKRRKEEATRPVQDRKQKQKQKSNKKPDELALGTGKVANTKLARKEASQDLDGLGGSDSEVGSSIIGDEFENLEEVLDDSSDQSSLRNDAFGKLDDDEENGSNSAFDSVDENGGRRERIFSEDEDFSDAEMKLTAANIEGLSRKLDKEKESTARQAQLELQESALQTNLADDRPDVFGDEDEMQPRKNLAPDLQLLRTRITDTIRILGDFAKLGQQGKSRADYTDLLLKDICAYYGYTPYLAEKLYSLFTPSEAFAFFEANETPRPVVIRTNTLRTNRRSLAQSLINRGVVLEPVGKWSKVGLQVFESNVPLGATPEYLAGHYIIQAASSFLPVMALCPQPEERILDMAAAPGGKTTYISALMRNTGSILANDANKSRTKGLIGNVHRLGCKNVIVSNLDARTTFPKVLGGFDRVLLDAPCSGTGVISKDPSVKTSKTEHDFMVLPHMQKQLLLAAIDSTNHASKTGGYIVYSTCSVTVEENEGVVQYALRKRPNVKIVDTGLGNFGSEGFKSYQGKKFDDKMHMTRRYFPHRENVDGFYVCKLKKTGPSPTGKSEVAADTLNGDANVEIVDKTPIVDDEKDGQVNGEDFGPFDDEEDVEYMARAERSRIRRKGLDPRAVLNGAKKDKGARDNKETQEPAARTQTGKKVGPLTTTSAKEKPKKRTVADQR